MQHTQTTDVDEIMSADGSQVTGIVSCGEGHLCIELDNGLRLLTFEGGFNIYVTERTVN